MLRPRQRCIDTSSFRMGNDLFHEVVNEQRIDDDFEKHFIFNIDETFVYLDILPGKTVN